MIVKDADAVRVGFVDIKSGLLFMNDEAHRFEVRQLLADMGCSVAGPPVEMLAQLQWLEDVYLSPGTRNRVKLLSTIDADHSAVGIAYTADGERFHTDTDVKLAPPLIGMYYPDFTTLSLCYPEWFDAATCHLQRLGVLELDTEPGLLGVDVTFPADNPLIPIVYPEPVRSWRPGVVVPTDRTAPHTLVEPRTPATRWPSCGLLSTAADLLPDSLAVLVDSEIHASHRHSDGRDPRQKPDRADILSRSEWHDPRGFWRPWRRGVRYDDGRNLAGNLPEWLYTSSVVIWYREIGAAYGGAWATVAAACADVEQPDLWHAAIDLWQELGRPALTLLAGVSGRAPEWSAQIEFLGSRLWRRTRGEGPWWPEPEPTVCGLCGEYFDPTSLDPIDVLRMLGPPRWCPDCCGMSWGLRRTPSEGSALSYDSALHALSNLAALLGYPPSGDWMRWSIPRLLSVENRDRLLLARAAMPSHHPREELAPGQSWTRWLQDAGVIGQTVRAGRGTHCVARDGHPCRSLFELAIDDYLDAAGIAHTLEPHWPWNAELNPSGRLRADWSLADGTFVEAAGMLESEDYRAKIDAKVALARLLDIPLIVITPNDLGRLAQLLLVDSPL